MEEMIIKLQETISHQGEAITLLSDELYIQQKEIAKLRDQYNKLESKYLEALDGNQNTDQEAPPPHY